MRVERWEERRLNEPRICHAFESTSANIAFKDRQTGAWGRGRGGEADLETCL